MLHDLGHDITSLILVQKSFASRVSGELAQIETGDCFCVIVDLGVFDDVDQVDYDLKVLIAAVELVDVLFPELFSVNRTPLERLPFNLALQFVDAREEFLVVCEVDAELL